MRRRTFIKAGAVLLPATSFGFPIVRGTGGKITPRLRLFDGINTGYGNKKPSNWATYIRGDNYTAGENSFTYPGGDHTQVPTTASIQALADNAEGLLCATIDIESYPLSTQEERIATAAKYASVLDTWLAQQPQSPVGVYGFPRNGPRADIIAGSGAGFDAWRAVNDDLNFFDHARQVQPSLYINTYEAAPYTDTLTWIENILIECRRLSNLPIVPFIWGAYHNGATGLNGTISNISTDNPAVVTVGANQSANLQTGMMVRLTSITGSDEIDNRHHIATRIGNNSFSLNGVDGAAITAYSSGGTYTTLVPEALYTAILQKIMQYTPFAIQWDYMPTMAEWEGTMPWWASVRQEIV